MPKLNTLEKKLKFHCSVCLTVYQLLESQQKLRTNEDDKCLNNCLQRWQTILHDYYQDQIFAYLARQEEDPESDLSQKLRTLKKDQT